MRDTGRNESRSGAAAAILLFVVVAAGLRLPAIDHGAPRYLFHPDVSKQAVAAHDTYRGSAEPSTADGRVELLYYPYGASILLGGGLRALSIVAGESPGFLHHGLDPEDRWLWARRLRIFGLLLLLVAGAVAIWTIGTRLGALPAVALSVSLAADPLLVEHSQYGMNDVPLAAFLLFAWLLQPISPRDSRNAVVPALVSGIALGVACGVKYQGALGALFPLLSLRVPGRRFIRSIAIAAGFGLGLMWACPLLFADPIAFARGMRAFLAWQTNITGMNLSLAEKLATNPLRLAAILAAQPFAWLVPAAVLAILRRRGNDGEPPAVDLLSGATLSIALIATLALSRDSIRGSDLLPAVPIVAVLAVHALRDRRPRTSRWFAAVLVIVPLVVQITAGVLVASVFTRPDTRLRALRWLEEHAPTGSRLLVERYTIPDGEMPWSTIRARYLFEQPTAGPLARGDFDFVVTSSLASDRFFDARSPFENEDARDFYRRLERELPLVVELMDRPLDFANPRITIRRRPEGRPATDRSPNGE